MNIELQQIVRRNSSLIKPLLSVQHYVHDHENVTLSLPTQQVLHERMNPNSLSSILELQPKWLLALQAPRLITKHLSMLSLGTL